MSSIQKMDTSTGTAFPSSSGTIFFPLQRDEKKEENQKKDSYMKYIIFIIIILILLGFGYWCYRKNSV